MKFKVILFVVALSMPVVASASSWWDDLWYNDNQQGARLLKQNQPTAAAESFNDPQWKAIADYRAGRYEQAIQGFSKSNTPMANYNRGNALAKMGQYQKAIEAYQTVLAKQPNNQDALHNKSVLEKLLQKKQHQPDKSKPENKPAQSHGANGAQGHQGTTNGQSKSKQQQGDSQGKPHPQAQSEKQQPSPQETQSKNDQGQSSQQKQQNSDGKQSQTSPSQDNTQNNQPRGAQHQAASPSDGKTMEQQSTKQWLGAIPDDPGGLLRQKFLRDHDRQQQARIKD